jgi:hypothetical protein
MKLTDAIKELSSKTFYKMENYSQLVIDLVETIEDSDLEDSEVKGAISYEIGNILEIINPSRVDDIKMLSDLKKILEVEQQIKKTSQEWQLEHPNLTVYDPDGWDRSNFQYSWYEELITYDEYQKRLMSSTVIGKIE